MCSQQTKKFDEAVGALKDQVACFTVSLDLPFAQGRFCTAEKITNVSGRPLSPSSRVPTRFGMSA